VIPLKCVHIEIISILTISKKEYGFNIYIRNKHPIYFSCII